MLSKSLNILFFTVFCTLIFSSCKTNGVNSEGPKTDTVLIQNMKFIPDTLSVNIGDTVVFLNKDIVAHNATEVPNKTWASPNLKMDESWKFTPKVSSNYFCSIHVVMKGRINVRQQINKK